MTENKDKPGQDTRKKKEIKEPFRPEDTPRPPQVMDTSKAPDGETGEGDEKQKPEKKKK